MRKKSTRKKSVYATGRCATGRCTTRECRKKKQHAKSMCVQEEKHVYTKNFPLAKQENIVHVRAFGERECCAYVSVLCAYLYNVYILWRIYVSVSCVCFLFWYSKVYIQAFDVYSKMRICIFAKTKKIVLIKL